MSQKSKVTRNTRRRSGHGIAIAVTAALAGTAALQRVAHAATLYWDVNGSGDGATNGTTASGNWNAGTTNWSSDLNGTATTVVYSPGSDVVFSAGSDATGSSTVTLVGSLAASSLAFQEGTVTFTNSGASALSIGSGGITMTGTSAATFNSAAPIVLTAAQAWTNSSSNGLTITGGVAINSALTLAAGAMTFQTTDSSGAGGVVIDGAAIVTTRGGVFGTGLLELKSGSLRTTTTANVTVSNVLLLDGNFTFNQIASGKNMVFSGGGTIAATPTLTFNDNISSGTQFITNALSLTSDVTFTGTGNALFAGLNGGVTARAINKSGAGTLAINGTSTLAAGSSLNITGGTVNLSAANALGSNALTLTVASASGTSSFNTAGVQQSVGDIVLGGASGTASNVGTGSGTIFSSGGVTYVATNNPNASTFSGNNLSLAAGSHTFSIGNSTAVTATAAELAVSATITGSGGITKTGAGNMQVSATNTFTGGIVVNGGMLIVNGGTSTTDLQLGAVPGAFKADAIVLDGGGLAFVYNNPSGNTSINANRGISIGPGGATISHTRSTSSAVILSAITGPGGVVIGGTDGISFVASSYQGGTTLSPGAQAIASADTAFGTGTLNLAGGGIRATTSGARSLANVLILSGDNTGLSAGGSDTTLTLGGAATLVGGNRTFTVEDLSSASITFANTIGDGGNNYSFTKAGVGTMIFSGNNSVGAGGYTGGTTIAGGVLRFNSANAIAGTGASIFVDTAGIASAGYAIDQAFINRIDTASTGSAALTQNSAVNLDLSAFASLGLGASTNAIYTGTLTPGGTTYRLGGGGATLSLTSTNALTSTRGLIVRGNVALTAANDFSQGTTLTAGTLTFVNGGLSTAGNFAVTGTSSLTYTGSTAQTFVTGRSFSIAPGATLTINANTSGGDVTIVDGISGGGSLVKTGSRTLTAGSSTLAGLVVGNNQSGGTVLGASGSTWSVGTGTGTMSVATGSATAAGTGTIDMSQAASFTANVTTLNIGADASGGTPATGTFKGAAATNLQVGAIRIGADKGGGTFGPFPVSSFLTIGSAGLRTTVTIANASTSTGISNTGSMDLTNASFNGTLGAMIVAQKIGTIVAAGDLGGTNIGSFTLGAGGTNHLDVSVSSGSALLIGRYDTGNGTNSIGGSGGITSAGVVTLANLDASSAIVSTAAGSPAVIVGALNNIYVGSQTGHAFTGAGTLAMTGGTLSVQSAGTNPAIYLGSISGASLKSGDQAVGVLNLTGGTLTVNNNIIGGSTAVVGASAVSTISLAGGVLDLSGKNIGVAGNLISNLVLESGGLQNVGEINNGGAVTKTSGGTFTLAGTNTFTGATSVAAGTLKVNGTIASSVGVASGATLGGIGKINAALAVSGTLAPGNSAGLLTVAGDVTLNTGSTYSVEVTGKTTAGTDYDQLVIEGTHNISIGGNLLVSMGTFSALEGDRIYIVNNAGSGLTTGAFSGLAEGAEVASLSGVNGFNWTITYAGIYGNPEGASNDVALVASTVPEPAGLGVLAIGGAALLRRRRRK